MPERDDELTDIPHMTPARDELDSYSRGKQNTGGAQPAPASPQSSGRSSFMTTVLVLAVIALLAAVFVLYQQSQQLVAQAAQAETRIAELEGRLSSTDESMSQSGVAMQVRLKELDSEVRKLWDNVWKKSKDQLTQHESKLKKLSSSSASLSKKLSQLSSSQSRLQGQVKGLLPLTAELEDFQRQSGSQKQLIKSLQNSKQKLDVQLVEYDERLVEVEGWTESNLSNRKQVGRRLADIEKQLTSLRSVKPAL